MTKEIRFLTGRHAGARLQLSPTLTRIGNDDEADIQISDWNMPTMKLSHHDDGHVSIADPSGTHPAVILDDFVPQRFGDIVLCAGDAQGTWPSDITLLEAALAPVSAPIEAQIPAAPETPARTPSATSQKRHGIRNIGIAGVAVLAIGCAGIALPAVLHPRDASSPKTGHEPDSAGLATALRQLQLHDIEVKREGERFAVVGVVPDSALETTARNMVETIAPGKIVWRVGRVDQITRDLQESLHDSSLQVRYLGDREFAVTGIARNANAARATIEQLNGDLSPMVTRIAAQFGADNQMAPPSDIESLLAVGNLQYMVSNDGTKHFVDTHPTPDTLN
ncbi:HrpD5 family protein [Burkholderia lata]|uniref:HrpD5 family protein n=1 Tax=Burkholderia lata (strain ATCC 17760 / DSM 23089 / LMG 22485 / NCIMB 9086 / R18194 / 383) TaxID=482957 RepID=UPI0014531102|nr:HrpD5 family protein [Burkholderia lata]VWB88482.1 secretion protein SctD [Burkholderia lata]